MNKPTRHGIYYNLSQSPYLVSMGDYILHFSSEMYRKNYVTRYRAECETIKNSLSSRFKVEVNAETLAIFTLYLKIEKRGFYVEDKKGNAWHKESEVLLDGMSARKKSSYEV